MVQGTNNNKPWLNALIKGIVVIVALLIILGFGLGFGFKLYNASLQYQTKALAQEKTTKETAAPVETTITETTAKAEETTIATTIEEKPIETTVETSAKAPFIPEGQIPAYSDSKDGVPLNGTELNSDVGYDEIWCATFGPGKFLGIVFPGGVKRGTVVIQLGPTTVGGDKVHYVITDLIPGASWQGNWHYNERLITEKDWMAVKDLKVKEMMGPDNATDSLGCNTVDVIVAQAGVIIFQETCQKQ